MFFLIWANPGLFFIYFRPFHITNQLQIEKSVDGMLGIRTRGRRMVGADKTTELWRPPVLAKLNARCLLGSHPDKATKNQEHKI